MSLILEPIEIGLEECLTYVKFHIIGIHLITFLFGLIIVLIVPGTDNKVMAIIYNIPPFNRPVHIGIIISGIGIEFKTISRIVTIQINSIPAVNLMVQSKRKILERSGTVVVPALFRQ
ncbi:hypothetical protein SDC9_103004 [bioreactor metagenome]|uniref:Uncharacterized protein n=1 Tax=bioreactor metagenome TaxID=1076179 RepID=A0A645ASF3_9ZZZZ